MTHLNDGPGDPSAAEERKLSRTNSFTILHPIPRFDFEQHDMEIANCLQELGRQEADIKARYSDMVDRLKDWIASSFVLETDRACQRMKADRDEIVQLEMTIEQRRQTVCTALDSIRYAMQMLNQ